jgi:hypothetical protein
MDKVRDGLLVAIVVERNGRARFGADDRASEMWWGNAVLAQLAEVLAAQKGLCATVDQGDAS